MAIQVGEKFPSVEFSRIGPNGMEKLKTDELLAGRTAIVFAVPGAFTPTCSAKHLPSYIERADALKEKGVDLVVCMAVNDPFVMKAWADAGNVGDKAVMLPDGNGTLTRALGLEMDGSGFGLGLRSQRFAMVVKDGVVSQIFVEKPGAFEVSGADHVLAHL